MGRSLVKRGAPLCCYNAANHWDLGWFPDGRLDLGLYGPTTPLYLSIRAFVNYPAKGPVLLKIAGNIYLQYNHASIHNKETDSPLANRVVIILKTPERHTIRLAALAVNEEYWSTNFVIKACRVRTFTNIPTMDVSIGRNSVSCTAPTIVIPAAPQAAPAPAPVVSRPWL
jgi:hypothetical protein